MYRCLVIYVFLFIFLINFFLDCIKNEIRIVFIGKIGFGKSVIGNIILNNNYFFFCFLMILIIKMCFMNYVVWFGKKIVFVDILGIFDIDVLNDKI